MSQETPATQGGFVTYDTFEDVSKATVRILADQDAVRILCTQEWFYRGPDHQSMPHLNVEMAKRVRDALDTFIREHEGENQRIF